MPKMNISKSITIQSPIDKIYKVLTDFHQWRVWSPWLVTEPEAQLDVADDGQSYSWQGERVGSGHMRIVQEQSPTQINYDLTFLKPWKSTAKVRFDLSEKDDITTVTWTMDSSLPLLMFWMKKMMVAFVGMDYQRGLLMLKDYVELGNVPSQLTFTGQRDFEGCDFVAIKTQCKVDEVGNAMQRDFTKLGTYLKDKKDLVVGYGLSIYHKYDLVGGNVEYTCGMQIDKKPDDLPEELFITSIPPTKTYTIGHTGPYRHLGNAWTTLMGLQRAKTFKAKKGMHPFEVYLNAPDDTEENELRADVCFPVR